MDKYFYFYYNKPTRQGALPRLVFVRDHFLAYSFLDFSATATDRRMSEPTYQLTVVDWFAIAFTKAYAAEVTAEHRAHWRKDGTSQTDISGEIISIKTKSFLTDGGSRRASSVLESGKELCGQLSGTPPSPERPTPRPRSSRRRIFLSSGRPPTPSNRGREQ